MKVYTCGERNALSSVGHGEHTGTNWCGCRHTKHFKCGKMLSIKQKQTICIHMSAGDQHYLTFWMYFYTWVWKFMRNTWCVFTQVSRVAQESTHSLTPSFSMVGLLDVTIDINHDAWIRLRFIAVKLKPVQGQYMMTAQSYDTWIFFSFKSHLHVKLCFIDSRLNEMNCQQGCSSVKYVNGRTLN